MGHELDYTKGRYAFAGFKKGGWHELGTVFTEQPETLHELMELAGQDYQVGKSPNIHSLPNGTFEVSEESFCTWRRDIINGEEVYNILGANVGKGYTVLQNEEAMSIIEPFFDQEKILIETAGVLKDGTRTFICCKHTDPIVIDPKDTVDNYFCIFNSHDGTMSVMAYFTPTRVVCRNTLQMSFHLAKRQIKMKHTTNVKSKLEQATRILLAAESNARVFASKAREMKKTSWTTQRFFDYIGNLYLTKDERLAVTSGKHPLEVLSKKKSNILTEIFDYSESEVGRRETNPGSAWWAYNAVTGYYSNVKNFTSDEKRLNSLFFGGSDQVMTKALALAQPDAKLEPIGVNLN